MTTKAAQRPKNLVDEFANEFAIQQMRGLLLVLNKFTPKNRKSHLPDIPENYERHYSLMKIELRRLVSAWMASGPDLLVLFKDEPELEKRTRHGKTTFHATPTGLGYLDWSPVLPDADPSPDKDIALTHFMTLITNAHWRRLGGPCKRCNNYFLKSTLGRVAYCSRTCSSHKTALDTMRAQRAAARQRKLARAQKLISTWKKTRLYPDWRDWVMRDRQFSLNWLTRAVKSGELSAPHN